MSIVPRDPLEPITPEQWAQLREAYPDGQRLWWALLLARDPDTWAELVAGAAVEPVRLDQAQLAWAREQKVVRLDATVADELGVAG
jgi:hypothetical protein